MRPAIMQRSSPAMFITIRPTLHLPPGHASCMLPPHVTHSWFLLQVRPGLQVVTPPRRVQHCSPTLPQGLASSTVCTEHMAVRRLWL
jgi:hypothetical protein